MENTKQRKQRYVSPEQAYSPTTVQVRGGVPCINLPIECRDIRYCRNVRGDGKVEFVPDPNGVVTALQDGYRTYAEMPAGTEGSRYRRARNRQTGEVTLTPISTPYRRRVRK